MEEVPPGYVAVGRVLGAWGVRGDLRVLPLTDRRRQLAAGRTVTVAGERRTIESARWQKGLVYLKLAGIDRPRGRRGASRPATWPSRRASWSRSARTSTTASSSSACASSARTARSWARSTEVLSTGANDVFVVRGDRGELLLPAIDEVVREMDLEAGRMVIEALPGLLP